MVIDPTRGRHDHPAGRGRRVPPGRWPEAARAAQVATGTRPMPAMWWPR